jgi:sugar transferase (PEP-CTERM/EpsH1 system associated)
LKILVALSRFPWPTDKGDKLRAWHQLLGLAEKNEVHLFCLSDESISNEALQKVKSHLASVTVYPLKRSSVLARLLFNFPSARPFQVAYFSDKQAIAQFHALHHRIQPDVVFCQLARMAEFCRTLKGCRKILDYQDAFSKGLERRLNHDAWWKKPIIRMEYTRLKKYEASIFQEFDVCTMISAQDAQLIDHPQHSTIQILPNGVDTDFYKPEPRARTLDLLFTGNMHYEPNVNCVVYMVEKVLPLLQSEFPHIQFVAAGKNPARELQKLSSRSLQLTGWVDDLRSYYQQTRLFVAPMQIGVGMQNKILEAMSMGLPVITSSLANNAIGAEHGKEVWIADTPEKVAEGIAYLLNNTELALTIGQNARELMVNQFSWNKQNAGLMRLFRATPIENSIV